MSDRWADWRATVDLDEYEARWDRLAAAGRSVHDEADFVASFRRAPVLDAGCGTGRVAIELDRRGIASVGADLDPEMLARACVKASHMDWIEVDLASLRLERRFAVIVMAGNTMVFVRPSDRAAVVRSLGGHLEPGLLIAGFSLERGGFALQEYDALCAASGLELRERWATWDRAPFVVGGDYHVSAHERVGAPGGDAPLRRTVEG